MGQAEKKYKAVESFTEKMNERKKEFIRTIADVKIELLKYEDGHKII